MSSMRISGDIDGRSHLMSHIVLCRTAVTAAAEGSSSPACLPGHWRSSKQIGEGSMYSRAAWSHWSRRQLLSGSLDAGTLYTCKP